MNTTLPNGKNLPEFFITNEESKRLCRVIDNPYGWESVHTWIHYLCLSTGMDCKTYIDEEDEEEFMDIEEITKEEYNALVEEVFERRKGEFLV